MLKRGSSRQSSHRRLFLDVLEDRTLPAGIIAVGAAAHNPPRVQVLDAQTQAVKYDFLAFPTNYRGGVNVAVGDINGDGTPDIVAAAGPGKLPQVKVYDGLTGRPMAGPLGSFLAYAPAFRGGVNVATGDVNGDGFADIITGAGEGGGPLVKVFSGADGSTLASFLAFSSQFRGGVRVAAGDFRHLLAADIVVAAGPSGSPRVRIFAGETQQMLADYLAFDTKFRGGVSIGTGDINHDGTIDVIAGTGSRGRGAVKVFSGLSSTVVTSFQADGKHYAGGVTVDAVDANGDQYEDIVVGLRTARGPEIRFFDGARHQLVKSFSALDRRYSGTVSVAGSVPRGRGTNYELGATISHEIPVLERLAQYLPIDASHPKGQFVPVTAGSFDGSQHVYVIAHGWAPGYRAWVDKYIDTHVLKWWETAGYNNTAYPAPSPNPGPDSMWLFQGYSQAGVTISPTGGLAEQITKADPHAVVLAYSWIDDSATTAALNNAIPQQAYLSEALTNINGMRMAAAIRQSLGQHFNGQIHLMGHSHGSKVATLAAVALKQGNGPAVQQLTIFDSPEIAATDSLNASNFLWHYFPQLTLSKHPGQGTFVDNYFSAFGVNYATMQIDGGTPLDQLVDTQLFAFPYSNFYQTDPGDWHAYPPAWYAQANAMPCTDGSTNGGLAWSPLLGHDPSMLASEWEQEWTRFNYSNSNQACLTNPSFTITPGVTFASVAITDANTHQPVSNIELGLGAGQSRTFQGTYSKNTAWSGLAFDYTFSGTGHGILKIQINDYLAYYVDSQYLPGGITQQVTINIGWPSTSQSIAVTLLPPAGVNSQASVTVSNFRQFDVSLL